MEDILDTSQGVLYILPVIGYFHAYMRFSHLPLALLQLLGYCCRSIPFVLFRDRSLGGNMPENIQGRLYSPSAHSIYKYAF